jgi:NADH:ubiquinone oxidoreductase subunit K
MNLSYTTAAILIVLGLIGVGFYTLLLTRNLLRVVIALQILGKAAMLLLVAAGRMVNQIQIGQSMAITVIVADTIVAVIAMALTVQCRRHYGTMDITRLTTLKR